MFQINLSNSINLDAIAQCQQLCFSNSLSSKLGKKYLKKSLQWFLVKPNRFLFDVQIDGVVVGFCGGFCPQFYGDGSTSGMIQYAFKEAVLGLIKNPFLLFNAELRKHYPLIRRNILKKFGIIKTTALPITDQSREMPFEKYVGLVVIGVHPNHRGTGVYDALMNEFENKALGFGVQKCVLSVKNNNARAIKAYTKMGWHIQKEQKSVFTLIKFI